MNLLEIRRKPLAKSSTVVDRKSSTVSYPTFARVESVAGGRGSDTNG